MIQMTMDDTKMEIRRNVRDFILENFLFTNDQGALKDADSLIDTGTMDSTGVLELMMFLEEKFKFKIADEEMLPENLDSVIRIVEFVVQKLAMTGLC